MRHVITDFQIPDPEKPIPESERRLGPSGELKDFNPSPLDSAQIIGRKVDEICTYVGTYGMGGPGFFGLRLGAEWLVISVWGAAEWMTIVGRNVQDTFYDDYGREPPLMTDTCDELSPLIVGQEITAISVEKQSFVMEFANETKLQITESSDNRPLLQGTKEPRKFADDDDLRKAVFLSPTIELWVD